jgi:hypothetical protein
MTPEQSKNLKAGDRVRFNGNPADCGTVIATEMPVRDDQVGRFPPQLYRPQEHAAG